MQSNFRENYFKARDNVAHELKEKYNLIESYRGSESLTLDSSNYSIHLTFCVPDGDEIYISEKGKAWYSGKSFRDFLYEKHPTPPDNTEAIKKIFKGSLRAPYSFEEEDIKFSFQAKLHFLKENYPEMFI